MTKSPMRGVLMTLQSEQTTGNGTVIAIPSSFRHHTLYITGISAPSAGAIQPESADAPDYSGTWAPVGGGPITVIDGELIVNFEGEFAFFRSRISTNIVDGTVTVKYIGAP